MLAVRVDAKPVADAFAYVTSTHVLRPKSRLLEVTVNMCWVQVVFHADSPVVDSKPGRASIQTLVMHSCF